MPNVFIQYWAMRVMAYLAIVVTLVALWGLWLNRRKKLATSRRFLWVATWMVILPFLMNTAGWLLTEIGRQPWIVQGIMLTKNGLSPSVSTTELLDQRNRLRAHLRRSRHRRPTAHAALLPQGTTPRAG